MSGVWIRRWWRLPASHFLLIGGLLYAGQAWVGDGRGAAVESEVPVPVMFTAFQIEQLDRVWQRKTGRLPGAEERRVLIRQAVDEELLYREALALRLDEGNPSVRQRLVKSMGFLADQSVDEETLYRQARELSLERSDPVVRQHLIGLMRNIARRSSAPEAMTEAQLEDYYRRHRDRFMRPARARLSHLYLSADRRGSRLDDDARRLSSRLAAEALDPSRAVALGDPFMLQHHLPARSWRELERTFGASFAGAVMDLEPGVWSGPIISSYGLHLVWIHERTEAAPAAFASVRRQVALGLEVERGERRLAARLDELRARYQVIVAPDVTRLARVAVTPGESG